MILNTVLYRTPCFISLLLGWLFRDRCLDAYNNNNKGLTLTATINSTNINTQLNTQLNTQFQSANSSISALKFLKVGELPSKSFSAFSSQNVITNPSLKYYKDLVSSSINISKNSADYSSFVKSQSDSCVERATWLGGKSRVFIQKRLFNFGSGELFVKYNTSKWF